MTLFDQGITQVLQAAVVGLEPKTPYLLALTSAADGTGRVAPIARFTTNPAGAQIVIGVGPIRQIVDPATPGATERRWLAVLAVDGEQPGRPVQIPR